MLRSPFKEVEILIHTSAPSGAKDDQRYRTEAAAYLAFETCRVTPVSQSQSNDLISRSPVLRLSGSQKSRVGEATNRSSGLTDHQVLPGNEDPILSESTRRRQNDDEPVSTPFAHVAWHEPDSVTSPEECSRPLPTNATEGDLTTYPHPLSLVRSSVRSDVGSERAVSEGPERPSQASGQSLSSHPSTQSGSWRTPSSVISDSQPPRDIRVHPKVPPLCSKRLSPPPLSDDHHCKRRRIQQSSSDVPHGKSIEGLPTFDRSPPSLIPAAPTTIIGSRTNLPPNSTLPATFPSPAIQAHQPPEIHPPIPATTIIDFKNSQVSHITPTLSMLASKLEISKRFQPLSTSRALRPSERGYWRVDTLSWDEQQRQGFWTFLQDLVEDGRVGWGVWCVRPEDGETEGNRLGDVDNDERLTGEKGVVRVYCWGEVVGHVYLVIFLASSRKIKGTGARWVDAGGEVVVQMA